MIPRPLHLFLAVASAAGIASPAHATDPARLVAAKHVLAHGVTAESQEAIVRARAEFEALSRAEPKSPLLHYWVAVADWRLAPRIKDAKQAQGFCADGLTHADRALALDPKFVEALALKASLQGISLRFEPGSAMSLGPEIEASMRRASQGAPSNPRVALFDAISTLNKPAFVGGGADKALAKLKHADELFAAESVADSTAPDWGREEAWIWAGRSAAALKDYDAARGFYQRVLTSQPRNAWVGKVLLPELEKAAAADRTAPGRAPGTSAAPDTARLGKS